MTFEEFLQARLGDLVRLAMLLSGSRTVAEQLVDAAVERSFVPVPALDSDAAVDAAAKRVRVWIVRGYLSEGMRLGNGPAADVDRPVVDTEPDDDWDDLTARFVTSSKLQRAVATLRFFEGLEVADIAVAMGSPIEDIERYLRRVAVELNMSEVGNSPAQVRALIQEYAEDVDPEVGEQAGRLLTLVPEPEPEPEPEPLPGPEPEPAAEPEPELRDATLARFEQARLEREAVERERADRAERARRAQEEADRAAAEQAERQRAAAALVEAELIEAERLEAEQRAEAERVEAEQREAARLEFERAQAERLAAERDEAVRRAAEQMEAERVRAEQDEAERLQSGRQEAERAEAERLEAKRRHAARIAAQWAEVEQQEIERLAAEREAAIRGETVPEAPARPERATTAPTAADDDAAIDAQPDTRPDTGTDDRAAVQAAEKESAKAEQRAAREQAKRAKQDERTRRKQEKDERKEQARQARQAASEQRAEHARLAREAAEQAETERLAAAAAKAEAAAALRADDDAAAAQPGTPTDQPEATQTDKPEAAPTRSRFKTSSDQRAIGSERAESVGDAERITRTRHRLALGLGGLLVLLTAGTIAVAAVDDGTPASGTTQGFDTRGLPSPVRSALPGTVVLTQYSGKGDDSFSGRNPHLAAGHELVVSAVCSGTGPVTIGRVTLGDCSVSKAATVTDVSRLRVTAPSGTQWRVAVTDQPPSGTDGALAHPADPLLTASAAASSGRLLATFGTGSRSVTVARPTGRTVGAVRILLSCSGSGVRLTSTESAVDGRYATSCFRGWSYEFRAEPVQLPLALRVTAATGTSWRLAVVSAAS